MKTRDRIAMVYAASVLGAAGVSYFRGRQGRDVLRDALVHGLVGGTGVNVALWLGDEAGVIALPNHSSDVAEGAGTMSVEAIAYLADLNDETLYAASNQDGFIIGPVPDNPYVVEQVP